MSKGPGWVQRAIIALIEANPHGAWTTEDLCAVIYPADEPVDKSQRVAVLRAMRKMTLPGTWTVDRLSRPGISYCLFDPCDDESETRRRHAQWVHWQDYADWTQQFPHQIEQAKEAAVAARKYRDASPVERLDIGIASMQRALGAIKIMGTATPEMIRPYLDHIEALQAERAELVELVEQEAAQAG
jgi:hypothetical protein